MTDDDLIWRRYSETLLGLTLWREARNQSDDAIIAVACSIRNRIDKPSWWGKDWISCLTKKWQYSSMTDPKDHQLILYPQRNDAAFVRCYHIGLRVMSRELASPFPGADSYYDESITAPYWATQDTYVGSRGAFRFHNLDRDIEVTVPVNT